MASLGEQLKQARERRGAGLDDIAQTTKIGTRFLRALETDDYDQLPGGIFNKGFIRAYAKAVGLDEDQAIADYVAATEPTVAKPEASAQSQTRPVEASSDKERSDPVDLPWGVFAVILLAAALGVAGWGFYSRQYRQTVKRPTPTAETNAGPGTIQQPNPAENAGQAIAANSAPSGQAASQPSTAAQADNQPSGADAQTAKKSDTSTAASSGNATAPQYFSVRVNVREDSWLSISADGKMILQGRFLAPALKSVRARNQVIVQTQNAGGLDFEFNGQSLPPQGKSDEVKTLIFGADGLEAVQATPRPASLQ